MKIISKEALIATMLAALAAPVIAEEEACTLVTDTLSDIGASIFASSLMTRGLDFKYGQFTIFAPLDQLMSNSVLILENTGYNSTTIDDIVLFHVSAETITEDITAENLFSYRRNHCGKPLLMLNEGLHVNQESSATVCEGGNIFQTGPGNVGIMPEVVGGPIAACNSVIYIIEDALMLPTLPVLPTPVPTPVPPETKPPTRQDPVTEPTEVSPEVADATEAPTSGSNALSLACTAFAGLVVAILI